MIDPIYLMIQSKYILRTHNVMHDDSIRIMQDRDICNSFLPETRLDGSFRGLLEVIEIRIPFPWGWNRNVAIPWRQRSFWAKFKWGNAQERMERCTSRTDLTEAALKTASQVQQESGLTLYRTMTTLGTTDKCWLDPPSFSHFPTPFSTLSKTNCMI